MPPAKKVVKKATKKVAKKVALRKAKRTRTDATPATEATTTPATTAAKKIVKKASKPAGKKTADKTKRPPTMSINFTKGTDMQVAWEEALKGGASRSEVSARLAERWADTLTRTGNAKPVSTILNHVVRRARANGYVIEQTWRLVKPDEVDAPTESAQLNGGTKKKVAKKVTKPGIKKTTKKVSR